MKIISFLIFTILLISCKGENYKNKELSFEEIDENGGITFLDLKIDENGKVIGTSGYNIYEQIKNYADIDAELNNKEITGTIKFEDENKTSNIKILLFDKYAILNQSGKEEIKLTLKKSNGEKNSIEDETLEKVNKSISCNNPEVVREVIEIINQHISPDWKKVGNDLVAYHRDASLLNIFTVEKNDELKSCGCEATFNNGSSFLVEGRSKYDHTENLNISYKAQLNDEGEYVVKVTF